jgi:hypothetical protein
MVFQTFFALFRCGSFLKCRFHLWPREKKSEISLPNRRASQIFKDHKSKKSREICEKEKTPFNNQTSLNFA